MPTFKNKSEVNDPVVNSRRYEVLRPKTDWKLCYTARFGVPPVAKKVYVRANQFVDGWESLPTTFWAIVPA